VQRFSFDDQAWKSNDSNANVRGEEGKIFYTANVDEIPSYNVYLDAPISWKNDYTSSYGLHIYFTVSCSTNDDKRVSSSAADVKLVSGDTVLDFWATQQPSDPTQPFKVNVTLLPDYWLTERGDPVTRSQLMMVLLKLERLRIKVSYLEHAAKATVEHLELEVAQNDYTNEVQSTASSVEICECPASYSGASCQVCLSFFLNAIWSSFVRV
jgi:laminin alpha 3/5